MNLFLYLKYLLMFSKVWYNLFERIKYMRALIELYLLFFKLGIVNFGGGYAMLPLLNRELVSKRGWVTEEELADYYSVGQCTPGAIAVNVSTFIGIRKKGILGGIVATLGFVSPAFLIIFIIAALLSNFANNYYVMNALAGIRACVFFLVLSAIFKLAKKSITDKFGIFFSAFVAIMAIFVTVIPLYVYVIIAGFLGFLINFIKEKKEQKSLLKKEELILEVDEKKEITKPQIKKIIINYKAIALAITGFFSGLIFSTFGFLSTIFIKNKYYKNVVFSSLILWFIGLFGIIILITFNSPIIFTVYFQFFKVGICAFGGGLATIPFLSELGQPTGWFSELDLANMIAVSESTPGAMGVNMSTYVGYTVSYNSFNNYFLAFLGSLVSTLGLVTPSIFVISIVAVFLNKFKDNKYVEWIFYGLRIASIGLIIAALYSIMKVSIFNQYISIVDGRNVSLNALSYSWNEAFKEISTINFFSTIIPSIANFFNYLFNWKVVGIGLLFGIGIFKFKKHPILYIAIAAFVGVVMQMYNVIVI